MTKSTVVQETWFATQTIQRLPRVFYPTPMTLKLPKISIEFSRKKEAIFIQIFLLYLAKKHLLFIQCAHASTRRKKNQSIIMFIIIIEELRDNSL